MYCWRRFVIGAKNEVRTETTKGTDCKSAPASFANKGHGLQIRASIPE
jgi:hypothetical protein